MAAERIRNFGDKLTLALKALNMSRGRLAATVGVDKSLVGRWASGQVMPSGHNLARISELVGSMKPGFTVLSWELPEAAFADLIGVADYKEAPAASEAGGYRFESHGVSLEETALSGEAYPGIYALFRTPFANTGHIMMEAHMIYTEGPELKFRSWDGFFLHCGHVMIMKGQLYHFGESETRHDGMLFCVFHGVNGSRAMVLHGLQMSVAADKYFTPTAVKVLMVRIAHVTGDSKLDRARLEAISPRITEINTSKIGRDLLPKRFADAIDNTAGIVRPDGTIDYGLRIPMERSFSISDTELGSFGLPEPELARALINDNVVPLRQPPSAA